MLRLSTGFIALVVSSFSSFSSFACDFKFDRVEFYDEAETSFLLVNVVRDEEGEEFEIKQTVVPLNADVKQSLLDKVSSGKRACGFGTLSPVSPHTYFLYELK